MYSGVAYVDSPECPDNLETGRASSSAVIKSIQSKAKNIRSAAPVSSVCGGCLVMFILMLVYVCTYAGF